MQLSIIIVSYQVKYFLEQCLHSVSAAIKNIDAEVWVVDNASTDGTVDYLQVKFSKVKFIVNTNNVGFAKANNQALNKCGGKYVLYLNPDTIVPEDCFKQCISFMDQHVESGAMGIKMIDGSGAFLPESKRSFPGPMNSLFKLIGLSNLFPKSKIFARYALAYLDKNKNHEVDVLSGAFMFCRREIILSLDGFDEAFFMYGEDIDLSYRIKEAGYKNYYFGESCIIHFKGESTKKNSIGYVKTFYNAMNIFVKKHYSGGGAIIFSFFFQMAIWLRAGLSALSLLISKINSNNTADDLINAARQYVVVGSTDVCNEMESLLRNAGKKENVIGKMITDTSTTVESIYTTQQQKITNRNNTVLVLCNEILSWKDIIYLVEKLKGTIAIRFHAKGSNSIVGSDSKNVAGEVTGV